MTCHNGRPGPDHPGDCYEWFKPPLATYTNKTRHWVVVLGLDIPQSTPGNQFFGVKDAQGIYIDTVYDTTITGFTAGTPTNVSANWNSSGNLYSVMMLNRRLLIPPGGSFDGVSATQTGSFVTCATFDHAIDLL